MNNKEKKLIEKWKDQIHGDWKESNKNEKRKYLELYDPTSSYAAKYPEGAGSGNHGKGMVEYLKSKSPQGVLDVGCGQGQFLQSIADDIPNLIGADIASVTAGKTIEDDRVLFIDSDALSLDLPDNIVDYVVSFDCLEHCLEEDIEDIISNFARMARKGFIFSITYRQAHAKSEHGENLHMTVKPESWWISIIEKHANLVHKEGSASWGGIESAKGSKYLCFELKD